MEKPVTAPKGAFSFSGQAMWILYLKYVRKSNDKNIAYTHQYHDRNDALKALRRKMNNREITVTYQKLFFDRWC